MSIENMRQSFKASIRAIKVRYGDEFLNCSPTKQEVIALEKEYRLRSYPGCIVALDCMSVKWKSVRKGSNGNTITRKKVNLASIQVETVSDFNLYCWHLYTSRTGTNNGITAMESSPLVMSILSGKRTMKLEGGYEIYGIIRQWYLYFLTDGIYPNWSTSVKPIHSPSNPKEFAMTAPQESRRKDVEKLFGVLQGRFRILRHEFHEWKHESISEIMEVCVIIYNMLIHLHLNGLLQDERDETENLMTPTQVIEEFEQTTSIEVSDFQFQDHFKWLQDLIGVEDSIRNYQSRASIWNALQEHIWNKLGNGI